MEKPDLLQLYIRILTMDFFRYMITAGTAFLIFWILLKNILAHRIIQRSLPKAEKLWMEFKYSMSTIVIFSMVGFGTGALLHFGYLQFYRDLELYGTGYFILSIIAAIIIHDTYFYWTHRWMHHPRIYKYVHKIHHKSTNPSPWAAYSFHPIEALVQALIFPILVTIMPMHGLAILSFLIYMIVRNVLGHLGFELFPKGFTRNKWFSWHTTSTHHNMHHHYFHNNYGLYFTWWDRIMKTEHPDYHDEYDAVTTSKPISNTSLEHSK